MNIKIVCSYRLWPNMVLPGRTNPLTKDQQYIIDFRIRRAPYTRAVTDHLVGLLNYPAESVHVTVDEKPRRGKAASMPSIAVRVDDLSPWYHPKSKNIPPAAKKLIDAAMMAHGIALVDTEAWIEAMGAELMLI